MVSTFKYIRTGHGSSTWARGHELLMVSRLSTTKAAIREAPSYPAFFGSGHGLPGLLMTSAQQHKA